MPLWRWLSGLACGIVGGAALRGFKVIPRPDDAAGEERAVEVLLHVGMNGAHQ